MSRTSAAASGDASSVNHIARAIARASPASTRPARGGDALTSGGQQLPCDHQPLHFARSLTDGDELHVAEEFFGGIILDESVAAVNLHAILGHAHGGLAR